MNSQKYRQVATAAVVFCLVFFSAGCATKKYVQNYTHDNIKPLEVKLDNTNKQVAENGERITDLDRKTEKGISQAQSSADEANQAASKAQQSAADARGLAQQGISDAGAVKQEVENADNFQSIKKATILFGIDKSKLTQEDIETLDSLAQTVSGMKHYVIEIRGFTDNRGPKQYNLQLSRKRADAVVRYLTLDKQIPLVRVYQAGYGEDDPAAPNKTRDGREQNRRVDVSILAPQSSATAELQQGQTPSSESQTQQPTSTTSTPQQ
jgi:outer membrane protein OmpA-like peptidoglycan-associated protein